MSDRVCEALSVCAEDQYELVKPTKVSDRECAAVTECSESQYESKSPSKTSDRMCDALTVCDQGEFMSKSLRQRPIDSAPKRLFAWLQSLKVLRSQKHLTGYARRAIRCAMDVRDPLKTSASSARP